MAIDQSSESARLFNLKDYVISILKSLKLTLKKTRLKFDLDMPPDLNIVSFPGYFSQIITNLIINSISHAYENGQEEVIKLNVFWQEDELVIDYSDDGRGIDAAVRDRLFDTFVTTAHDRGGSGLNVYSEPGQGTRFVMAIPKQNLLPVSAVSPD